MLTMFKEETKQKIHQEFALEEARQKRDAILSGQVLPDMLSTTMFIKTGLDLFSQQ